MTRRLRPGRLALAAVVVLALGVAAVVVDIRRDLAAAPAALYDVATTEGAASYQPGGPDAPFFVLVVGSDERPGLEGARADALHVVGLNPAEGRATILNIPRDTWVDIPGRGQGRVNEAYYYGGAGLQARTVEALVGVPIRFVLVTTFVGLVAMVDAMGGLEVDVPYPMFDPNSGADFAGGRVRMDGTHVLAFARNRHIPTGDFARSAHQGQIIIHALEQLRAQHPSGTDIVKWFDVLFRNVRLHGVGPSDLYRLGRAALAIDPGAIRNYTIPGRLGFAGSAAVVFVRQPQATGVFVDFADDAILQAH